MQELLISEIMILIHMDHPNISQLYQCVYDNAYINIVMELVNGRALSDVVIEKGKLPEERCKVLLFDLLCAIKYYQERNIVHRDLKLDNIVVNNMESECVFET